MLFFPIQQELDCITQSGDILGKIRFDDRKGQHVFVRAENTPSLSTEDQAAINDRLTGLDAGKYSIPMQDDD